MRLIHPSFLFLFGFNFTFLTQGAISERISVLSCRQRQVCDRSSHLGRDQQDYFSVLHMVRESSFTPAIIFALNPFYIYWQVRIPGTIMTVISPSLEKYAFSFSLYKIVKFQSTWSLTWATALKLNLKMSSAFNWYVWVWVCVYVFVAWEYLHLCAHSIPPADPSRGHGRLELRRIGQRIAPAQRHYGFGSQQPAGQCCTEHAHGLPDSWKGWQFAHHKSIFILFFFALISLFDSAVGSVMLWPRQKRPL